MRKSLLLLPLVLGLAACQSPRDACISNASGNLRTLNSLVAQSEANLARGYAIGTRQEIAIEREWCTRTLQDGSTINYRCDRPEVVERDVPVAINLDDEAAKLATLRKRQADLQRAVAPAIAQCQLAYPES